MPKKKVKIEEPKVIDSSVKFAWAYLLKHGRLTNGKWSFYGSSWESVERGGHYSLEKQYEEIVGISEKAVKVGIDWNKTDAPSVEQMSVFDGTFSENDRTIPATLGKLVLLNGESYLIGSNDEYAASLSTLASLMRQGRSHEVTDLAEKL